MLPARQKRALARPHYRWLWVTTWLLGMELKTSGRTGSACNPWAIPPALKCLKLYIRLTWNFSPVVAKQEKPSWNPATPPHQHLHSGLSRCDRWHLAAKPKVLTFGGSVIPLGWYSVPERVSTLLTAVKLQIIMIPETSRNSLLMNRKQPVENYCKVC